jgi:hypothetical protein
VPLDEKYNFTPDNIHNIDEIGISILYNQQIEVLGLRGKRQSGDFSSAERGVLDAERFARVPLAISCQRCLYFHGRGSKNIC